MKIEIKELKSREISHELDLVWDVFFEYESPDYTDEGIREFYDSIHDTKYIEQLSVFGAYNLDEMVGKLFDVVLDKNELSSMTVNSSPFAVPVYHKFGFRDTDREQVVNGLSFHQWN